MAPLIYTLCMLTSLACAWMLLRGYTVSRHRLLLWSGLCFVGLTLSNFLLVLDLVVYPELDMSTLRMAVALVAISMLLFGLIWENK
jgi:hypothetical protein